MERVLIQWNDILHVTANTSEGKMKVGLGLGVGYLYRTKKDNSFSCIKLCKAPLHRVQTPMSSINTRVWQVVHYWVSSMCCSFLKNEIRSLLIYSLYKHSNSMIHYEIYQHCLTERIRHSQVYDWILYM